MRALTVSALSDDLSGVALRDVPEPERRPGQLLVRVRAAFNPHNRCSPNKVLPVAGGCAESHAVATVKPGRRAAL